MKENKSFFFSVVVPTHFRPEKLSLNLASLEKQSFPHEKFEVIVVPSPNDPGSKIGREFSVSSSVRVRVEEIKDDIFSGKNVSAKRNHGARIANAHWLAFIDDDCVADAFWLESAYERIRECNGGPSVVGIAGGPTDGVAADLVGGVEGRTLTPDGSEKTLTWKGLQRLGRFGGYQTCNIFYEKYSFESVGGFDEIGFPWFLEDTDLAWSILTAGKKILSSQSTIVFHPVGAPAPWRLLHEAKGAGLKVKLFKKHPKVYREKKMRALRTYHYVYLFLWFLIFLGIFTFDLKNLLGLLTFFCLLIGGHMIKQFRGLQTSAKEVFAVAWRTALAPIIALVSVVNALVRHSCTFREWIYLLKPAAFDLANSKKTSKNSQLFD